MNTTGKPSRGPRKHHYVPVFYQKKFTNEAGLVWVYDRAKGTYKELHPLVVCVEKDFYAVKPEHKNSDMRVESEILSQVDGLGSHGIRDFEIGKPDSESEQEVALFMAFQYMRLPTISRDIRTTYGTAMQELTRVAFADVERAKVVMERYARDTDESVDVTPESMVEAVQGKHIEIVATEIPFLRNMMTQAMDLAKLLVQLDWVVLVAPQGTGFVISDCPVVVVPRKGSDQIGFLAAGSVKYMPLSRQLCLRLGEPGRSLEYKKIAREAVRIVNQNIAANSERFIMSPSRRQLEHIVSRSESATLESKPRSVIEKIDSDEDGALLKLSTLPRRYFYAKHGIP